MWPCPQLCPVLLWGSWSAGPALRIGVCPNRDMTLSFGNNLYLKPRNKYNTSNSRGFPLDLTRRTYRKEGVDINVGPSNSRGYWKLKKKNRWPITMPMRSSIPPPRMIKLNANNTQGRYMALKLVPNQKLTTTSLFNWHQIYKTVITAQSIKYWKENLIVIMHLHITK